ncbi:MAG: M48 family metalloprotease [Pseudomonadota bacterium]|nr:M48 family metalloprotease [Pseudomonadota bacterium]
MLNVAKVWRLAPVLVVALAACGSVVQNPVTGKNERSAMSVAEEIKVGAEQHKQVLADYGVVQNPALQAYVSGIGRRLASHSQRPDLDWHFTVLDSSEVNAFALPGGYVYVTRGIMAFMDSEADLAGVMGHEIGHVTARHGAARATRQQTAGFGVLAATVLGAVLESQGVAGAGSLASQGAQNAAAGYIASYSRDQELQADELGADYLAGSDYDPKNMVDVIEVLKNQERFAADQAKAAGKPAPQGGGWLASHPTNDARLQQIRAKVAGIKRAGHPWADDGQARYLKAIDGLSFGDSPAQGLVRGRNFYHGPLGFALTAPAGWSIQNSAESLVLVDPQGDAGLVLQPVPEKAGNDPESILRQQLGAQQGRTERRSLNGLPATHFEGTARNAQGQSKSLVATIVSGPGNRAYVLGYAARDAQALQRAEPGLREAEASFRALTAADRAAAKPWVLNAVPYPRGGFAQLARSSPLGPNAESQLRLLNGVYVEGEPRLGQLVKVVE